MTETNTSRSPLTWQTSSFYCDEAIAQCDQRIQQYWPTVTVAAV